MKKVLCVIAILGLAGMASAAEHWRGSGWGGDGTSWNDVLNWDDAIPSTTSWDVNVAGEQGTPWNHDIHITANGTSGQGYIENQSGYTVDLTVESGVTFENSSYLDYRAAGQFTVQSNAWYDMRYGQLGMENGGLYVTVEPDADLWVSTLRHNNGGHMDVYGTLWAWKISRISAEGTYYLNVHNGGLLQVVNAPDIPVGGWSDGGYITVFVSGTVQLAGDHQLDYLNYVQAGEAGDWDVSYAGGVTSIHLAPEPVSLMLLGLGGLVLLRRRRC